MTLTRNEQIEALTNLCVTVGAAELVGYIADNMRYDRASQRIVIDVPNTPDHTFPDDRDLDDGPLTLVVWRMTLAELSDALPPFDEP